MKIITNSCILKLTEQRLVSWGRDNEGFKSHPCLGQINQAIIPNSPCKWVQLTERGWKQRRHLWVICIFHFSLHSIVERSVFQKFWSNKVFRSESLVDMFMMIVVIMMLMIMMMLLMMFMMMLIFSELKNRSDDENPCHCEH